MSQFSGLIEQSGYAAHRWEYAAPTVGSRGGGVRGSKKRKYTPEDRKTALDLLDSGYTVLQIGRRLGIPAKTVETWKRRR